MSATILMLGSLQLHRRLPKAVGEQGSKLVHISQGLLLSPYHSLNEACDTRSTDLTCREHVGKGLMAAAAQHLLL